MKKYHVYGIGNALLDMDFEVSTDLLITLDIDKGVMTLIDENKHHQLITALNQKQPVQACGGSAANTLCTLQQLGAKTFYSCKIGDDAAGDFYYQDLLRHGIHSNLHENGRSGTTGKCIVLVTPDADRTMNTFLGATAEFSREQLSEAALLAADYLYIEGYLVAQPTALAAALHAKSIADQAHIKTVLTLSDPNMVTYFKAGLCDLLQRPVDILFCNEQEALLFTESDNLNAAKIKLKDYAKTFVITTGKEGAIVYNGQEFYTIPSYPVPVVDTVGAGDVFAGAFLYGITHGYGYYEAGDLANYAAGKVVTKFGPRLNNDEIEDVKSNLKKESA